MFFRISAVAELAVFALAKTAQTASPSQYCPSRGIGIPEMRKLHWLKSTFAQKPFLSSIKCVNKKRYSMKSPWAKVFLGAATLIALFLALRFLKIYFSLLNEEQFRGWVESLGVWGPLLYIVVYILRPLLLLPASIVSATAGIIWGPVRGFFYVQVAANISSTVEFWLSRYFARGLIERSLKGKLLNLDEQIKKNGFVTVLLIRLIPNVAWDIQNISLGITKIAFRDYFWATFFGIMPLSFAVVFFGSSLIKILFNPKNVWIAAIAMIFFAGVYYVQKYLKKKFSNNKNETLRRT